jgi:hypothetical protein
MTVVRDNWGFFAEPAPSMAEVREVWVPRREQRERIAKGLAIIKAATRAGLQVKGAVIEGVAVEFGEPDTPQNAVMTPLEAWKEKRRARQA